jgi:hypothetical protein
VASPADDEVITANGDVYRATGVGVTNCVLVSNVFSGATPALRESWGQSEEPLFAERRDSLERC